jgi:hypothetical protein
MAASLRSTIDALAAQFASGVLAAIRSASLEEILAEAGGRSAPAPGRRGAGKARATRVVPASPKGPAVRTTRAKFGKGGRLARRSAEDIDKMVDRIVALLEKNPEGLRAEQIRDGLGVLSKELPRPLAEGVKQKRFAKKGEKRATTYFLVGGAAKAATMPAVSKPAASKAGRRVKARAKRAKKG